MFSTLKLYVYGGVFIVVTSIISYLVLENKALKIDVQNGEEAIVAYESLLKSAPFEAKFTEMLGRSNVDINKTLSDVSSISDGNYSL